ncbi:MAG: winged helix-turn-helix domain-containing protein [Phycisphaeraceae bacterium]|nr:winged helix-turn-helix domain-containing protein [Phycisphaeraceae bacterium]
MTEPGAPSGAGRYRLGEVEFDARSGEVRRGGGVTRLPPQPAQLLTLLIQRRGELVTHEEIREALWPGVRVEFDQNLHFCVRQIRAALGESAAEGSSIETLARRGYRLRVGVEAIDDQEGARSGATMVAPDDPARHGASRSGEWRNAGRVIGLVAAVALIGVVALVAALRPAREERVRLAIMPFVPPESYEGPDPSPIATLLLAELGADEFEVVGPTTTERFGSVDLTLKELASELRVRYVVNARFVRRDGGLRLAGELIRASDGAHVWVEIFEDVSDADAVARAIAAGVRQKLAESPRTD